jgi:endonuclease III
MPRKKMPSPSEVLGVMAQLSQLYPNHSTELSFEGPFQLLAAVILSAQCTDERVNQTTPALFAAFPTPAAMAEAEESELEKLVYPCGFYRMKARALKEMATSIEENFQGKVPETMEGLVSLRGVGRKTASVVLNQAFGHPAIAVDTHVKRVAKRLGWTHHEDPVKIESDLKGLLPSEHWGSVNGLLIHHGRRSCKARKTLCVTCPLQTGCAFFQASKTSATMKRGKRPSS